MSANPAAPHQESPHRRRRLRYLVWILATLGACAFVAYADLGRAKRALYVSGLASWSLSSPPGRAIPWQPTLLVPGHDNHSYELLDQVRQTLEGGGERVRYVDYENAPLGHEVLAPSPYRWWLGGLARLDGIRSPGPPGRALERSALVADPLLHLLFLAGAALLVTVRFGGLAGALVAAAIAVLYPLASAYLPGAPSDTGLGQALAALSVLLVLAGVRALGMGQGKAFAASRRWFAAGGIVGGLGIWIGPGTEVPVLAGVGLGGLVAAWFFRPDAGAPDRARPPWRAWSLAGAATVLGAFLVDYFPAHMAQWELRVIHPLFGLAWLGAGEILARASGSGPPAKGPRGAVPWILAVAGLASVPVALWRTHDLGFLTADLPMLELSRAPGAPRAADVVAWLSSDGPDRTAVAVFLPLVVLLPALWLLLRRASGSVHRGALAVALGPAVVAAAFACRQLAWWAVVDGALLGVLAVTTCALAETCRPSARALWSALAAALLVPGALVLLPRTGADAAHALNPAEVNLMIERDFARWLAAHAGSDGAVVVAPPDETTTLFYYGRVRGLATLGWENRAGLGAAVRIAAALTPEEAQELVARRGVTHIVIPGWDGYLDIYARMGLGRLEGSFIDRLHRWDLPPWLRPVPYIMPTIGGFEGQSVVVLRVVDPQNEATAAARLAEYFVEMNQPEQAAAAAQALRRFPSDLGALVALAQVENARGDAEGFGRTVGQLLPLLSGRAERTLPWDRRVSLAVVLALAQRMNLARPEIHRCLAEIDASKLRGLSAEALYRLEVLGHLAGESIGDPQLQALALDLLPSYFRERLER